MPIQNREDAVEVETQIASIFVSTPDGRTNAIRRLFVETLDFDPAPGQVNLAGASANVQLPEAAERVAVLDGVSVVYVPLNIEGTDRVRKTEVDAAARLMADQLGDDILLVFTNTSASQLHFILPKFEGARPTLRRMVVERDLPRRTAVQQVAGIYWNNRDKGIIGAALNEAFDVEPVTKDFFAEYKRIFEDAMGTVVGFGDGDDEDKRTFVQTLFNRLMFIYFLSRKGWLRLDGDADYLSALWQDYGKGLGDSNFHRDRLRPLFFSGLNNPNSRDLTEGLRTVIGDVPFLNGGLFEETDLDRRDGITVPDEAIRQVLTGLFERFNFTVMESTPFDIEVAVDPEMLGKVFEELVTGRHDSGAYYTPRPVVSFMCREALKGYLEGQDTGLDADAIARFVDQHDTEGIGVAQARRVAEALAEVTVVDPACGSGAYLLGMMQELIELQVRLFNVTQDAKSLYDLKLEIIQRNLYGVDIDSFAVNIAMLRMWLSLAIDYEGTTPEPLPNLDFKVVWGDSLMGPDPSSGSEVQGGLGYSQEKVQLLGQLKGEFLRESDGDKKGTLRTRIAELNTEIGESLGAVADDEVLNWRVEFAEVFGGGRGFDIAIANPPYVQLQKDAGKLGNLYKDRGFATFARTGDIYQLFYERGCQMLQPNRGILAYITSNSWLKAEYGKATRRYFAEKHTPLLLLELGKDVFASAIVDSGVLMLRTGGKARAFPAMDMDRAKTTDIPPVSELWGQARPGGDAPWSILSATEQSVMDKMLSVGTPLKEWDIAIYRGITTGLNDAFIIDNQTKEALVNADPKSAEILKPVVRGRDIRRYRAQWASLWLIDTHNGHGDTPAINIDDFPAVKAHLDGYFPSLAKRYDKGVTPYNLRNCAYHADFAGEKLFWMDLTDSGRFAYEDGERFCLNTVFMMTGQALKYHCAVLNSKLVTWFMSHTALNSGMGVTRWIGHTVEQIPVPDATEEQRDLLVRQVNQILEQKAADHAADTESHEDEINRLVYSMYGLADDEIATVNEGDQTG